MKKPLWITLLFPVLALLGLPAVAAGANAPAIQYLAPNPVRNHEATLHFTIDPGGLETSYEVMYGEVGEDYRPFHEPLDGKLPAAEEPVAVEKHLPVYFEGALQPGTEYHWRVLAKNGEGETVGADQTFTTTEGPKPAFVNGTGVQTGTSAALFTGTVDPKGASLTGCRFRWVTATNFHQAGFEKYAATEWVRFGSTVPCQESSAEIGPGSGPITVHGEATGLEPGEYFFRLEGENAYEDGVAVGGVPFTVTADFGKGDQQPGPLVNEPSLPPPAPPAAAVPPTHKKPCPSVRRGKALKAKAAGKKHRHRSHPSAKHGHGKACGRRVRV